MSAGLELLDMARNCETRMMILNKLFEIIRKITFNSVIRKIYGK